MKNFKTVILSTFCFLAMFFCGFLTPNTNIVNAAENEVWLGGIITNASSALGTKSNPYQTFEDAKNGVAENGIIYINKTISITNQQNWSLPNNSVIKRAENFTRPLISIDGGTLNLSDITIDGNNQFSSGSLIEVNSGALNITNGTILKNNYNAYNGGAINATSICEINITNAQIINNTSEQLGGAIYANGSEIYLTNTTIDNNIANVGGAIYLNNSNMYIDGGSVSNNKVETFNSTPQCAGIYMNGNVTINSDFTAENNLNNNVQDDILLILGNKIIVNTTTPPTLYITAIKQTIGNTVAVETNASVNLEDLLNLFNFVNNDVIASYNLIENKIYVTNLYSLTYNANNGSDDFIIETNISDGTELNVINNSFTTPNNYTFAGWSTKSNGDVEFLPNSSIIVNNNINLYAVYTKEVIYNTNGGSGNINKPHLYNQNYKTSYGSSIEKAGHTLVGWQMENGYIVGLGEEITLHQLYLTNFTLTAVWEVNKYKVTFNSNGGKPVASQLVAFENYITKPETSKLGYSFDGWFEQVNQQISSTAFDFTAPMPNKNITLVAKWTKIFENANEYSTTKILNISNYNELILLATLVNNNQKAYFSTEEIYYSTLKYQLVNNIDLNNSTLVAIGLTSSPFKGEFNGNNYFISNGKIDNTETANGVFGHTNNAKIFNLYIKNFEINASTYTGGLIGVASNTLVEKCYFEGNILGEENSTAGGLVGYADYNTSINKNIVNATIKAEKVGGIVAELVYGSVNACITLGEFTGTKICGGIVGNNGYLSSVNYCYTLANTKGTNSKGSVVATNDGSVNYCYYNKNINKTGGINNTNFYQQTEGLSSGQMASTSTEFGFGFSSKFTNYQINNENCWEIIEPSNNIHYYPILNNFNTEYFNNLFKNEMLTVTFLLVNDNTIDEWTQLVKANEYVIEPTNKTDMFLQWYKNDGTEWIFGTNKLIESINLIAYTNEGIKYFAGGDGSENNPYQISTTANLLNLANLINLSTTYSQYYNKHYILTNNLSFNGNIFVPIGKNNKKFSGVFDGNNYTLSDITINFNDYSGIFAINDGVIKNLTITNINVKGENYVGAIAGVNNGTIDNITIKNTNEDVVEGNSYVGGISGSNNGKILNCYSNVKTSGKNNVGGITGFIHNTNASVMHCINTNNIKATNYAGGIVGYMHAGLVKSCVNLGDINSKYAGGIAGYCFGGNIEICANNSTIYGNDYVGGLVGYIESNALVKNSYNVGSVLSYLNKGLICSNNGNFENCYYNKTDLNINAINSIEDSYGQPKGMLLCSDSGFSEIFNNSFTSATLEDGSLAWSFQSPIQDKWFYPLPTKLKSKLIPIFYETDYIKTTLYYPTDTETNTSKTLILKNGYPTYKLITEYKEILGIANNNQILSWFTNQDKTTATTEVNSTYLWAEFTNAFEGEGSATLPFVINNENELKLLSDLINSKITNPYYSTKTYIINQNINLNNENFTPIGLYEDLPFSGTILGNNKTISGINISLPYNNYVGLFGTIKNANIKNLYIDNSYIYANSGTGTLVGYAENSNIENCQIKNSEVVCANENCGGIAGKTLQTNIANCLITNSYINAFESVGGVVGIMFKNSAVSSCVSDCTVFGNNQVGGIVGASSESIIENCANFGDIEGNSYVGGIAGIIFTNSNISNSFNAGIVNYTNITNSIGAVVGNSFDSTVQNSYYNIEKNNVLKAIKNANDNQNNVTGISTYIMSTNMFKGNTNFANYNNENQKFYYPIPLKISNYLKYEILYKVQELGLGVSIKESILQNGYVLNGTKYTFSTVFDSEKNYIENTLVVKYKDTVLLGENNIYTTPTITENSYVTLSATLEQHRIIITSNLKELPTKYIWADDGMNHEIELTVPDNYYITKVTVNDIDTPVVDNKIIIENLKTDVVVNVEYIMEYDEKSVKDDNLKVIVEGDNIRYDTEIVITTLTKEDEIYQTFSTYANGNIKTVLDISLNNENGKAYNDVFTVFVYVGSEYNNNTLTILLWANDKIYEVNSIVKGGYASVTLSTPRPLAVVLPTDNIIWIIILAIGICLIVFLLIFIFIIHKHNKTATNNSVLSDVSAINLNTVPARNSTCETKIKNPTPQELKKEKEQPKDELERKIMEEKLKNDKKKLGNTRRKQVE